MFQLLLLLSIGQFYLLGQNPKGGLMIDEHLFQKMGVYYENNRITL